MSKRMAVGFRSGRPNFQDNLDVLVSVAHPKSLELLKF